MNAKVKARRLALLKARLEARGLTVAFGDSTTKGGYADLHYLMTIFSADGEDGLWVMDDWGLTPVIYRAYSTPRLGTVDPAITDIDVAIHTILQLLPPHAAARSVHNDGGGAGTGT